MRLLPESSAFPTFAVGRTCRNLLHSRPERGSERCEINSCLNNYPMFSRRPSSIVLTVSRSALVPVASPAMCFTSGSGASSRSIFNDLFAVIRLNLEPCWPTYCLSSAASGPALLSRFTSPSTGIRPQVWQLAAILLSVCVAHNPFCLPGSLTLLCRCGAARWRSPLLAKSDYQKAISCASFNCQKVIFHI